MNICRFLTPTISLSLGAVVALAQFDFSMTATLHRITESGDYEIQFFAQNLYGQDLRVDGSHFTVAIGDPINNPDTAPKPFFVVDSTTIIDGSPFEPPVATDWRVEMGEPLPEEPVLVYLSVETPLSPISNWATFRAGEAERVMTLSIRLPTGLTSGQWSVGYYNPPPFTDFNNLGGGQGTDEDPNLGRDYTLGFTYYRLVLTDGDMELVPVPEPSQFALVGGLALLGFAGWRRSRK